MTIGEKYHGYERNSSGNRQITNIRQIIADVICATLMACGPESSADVMMSALQEVDNYYVIGVDAGYRVIFSSEEGGSIILNTDINAK